MAIASAVGPVLWASSDLRVRSWGVAPSRTLLPLCRTQGKRREERRGPMEGEALDGLLKSHVVSSVCAHTSSTTPQGKIPCGVLGNKEVLASPREIGQLFKFNSSSSRIPVDQGKIQRSFPLSSRHLLA